MVVVPSLNADSVCYAKEKKGSSMVLEQYENKEQKEVVENGPSMYLVDCVKRELVDVLMVEVVPNK